MTSPWSLRDYVFAAFMTIGMVASVFVIGPLVPPFFELVAWAPFGGIFLTLGMARLQRRGSVALMISPLALLLAPISPVITLYLALTTLVTEAVVFFRGNYRAKANRFLGTVVFFVSAVVIGLVSAGLMLGDRFAELLTKPWLIGGLAIAAGITGTLGWWLGEKIVSQLRRAGKLDADQ
jgi:energy-coupling factor transport system substrate-specific component